MSCLGNLYTIKGKSMARFRDIPRGERVSLLSDLAWGLAVAKDKRLAQLRPAPQAVDIKLGSSYELCQAWDAIHRALTNGKLEYGADNAPGCWVILGGEVLYGGCSGENDHIITCKSPDQVQQAAQYLQTLTEEKFRELYFAICAADYGMTPDEDDFGFTWGYLEGSIDFWKDAAEKQLWVLFDVDQ